MQPPPKAPNSHAVPKPWGIELFAGKPGPRDTTPTAIVAYAHIVSMAWHHPTGVASCALAGGHGSIEFNATRGTWEQLLSLYAFAVGASLGADLAASKGGDHAGT